MGEYSAVAFIQNDGGRLLEGRELSRSGRPEWMKMMLVRVGGMKILVEFDFHSIQAACWRSQKSSLGHL